MSSSQGSFNLNKPSSKLVTEAELLEILGPENSGKGFTTMDFQVRGSESDVHGNAHLNVIFSYFEETAHKHVAQLNLDFAEPEISGNTWVLNRISLEVDSLPQWREKVRVYTWQSGQNRLGFFRDFYLFNEAGQALLTARSFWTVMNFSERKLIPSDELFKVGENHNIIPYFANDKAILKLNKNFADFSEGRKNKNLHRFASYSDIDTNAHVNNTHYIEFIRACSDLFNIGYKVLDLNVNYLDELLNGDLLNITATITGETADSTTVAVRCRVEDNILQQREQIPSGDSFRALITYAKE